ncbi:isoleucyl-tRNA synthetase [Chryseobacterium sp. FH1]|uniref:type IX secretion system anionic LPS delivery protein PorZ n=1 Tax=Chryseobacterium sp. FH1 TaxID=1233951 RepID=UPI0004E44D48|nr:isoleucyl-tRNA synthetase [Chryseobacterium sp. FH1]KFC18747.1 isoleucyl-tRNA synthetase [Chryseobacterium sp. FH1]
MKKILLIITIFTALVSQAQTSKWSDLFSYNNVLAIREDNGRLIAATENGIFYYNPSSGEITKLSKANGLHEVKISAFDYNPATKTGIVGYQNGSMDVITPNGIFLIVDIPLATGYNGSKKINHISINGDRAIISVGYGVSIFNIARREFGDTAFFATGGVYTAANSAVLKDNTIYVATNSGIKSHEINATFPVFTTWATIVAGAFKKIDANSVVAFANGTQVKYGNGANFSDLPGVFSNIQDLKVTDSQIIVTDQTQVYVYNTRGLLQKNFNVGENINTTLLYNNAIFVGTQTSGIYNEQKNSLKPDGPYNNRSYKLSLLNNQIWVASGSRDGDPADKKIGFYHYDGSKWNYPQYFLNTPILFNILDVVPDPANPTEVYFTNIITNEFSLTDKGVFKMRNNEFVKRYSFNDGNAYYYQPMGLAFDENNNLFCSVQCTIPSLSGFCTISSFYLFNKSNDNFGSTPFTTFTIGGAQKPVVKNGILYFAAPFTGDGGVLMYDYNNTPSQTSDDKFKVLKTTNNLPINGTSSVIVDNNDDVWIGNNLGLRTLSNPKSAILEDNPQTNEIIIEENGLAEELFRDAKILQIANDTGNQKWISVDGGGVFYLSSNGDRTIYHFTKANSPLPNDSVTDIKIDSKSGKVYFATFDGIMVYQGDVTDVTSNFGNVLVYPNPVVYAQYKGNVRIRGLASKTNIRITDAAGNLVHSAVANGGYFEWNLANQRGVRVASGIYYVLMTNEDGTDTATAKIAVVN